MNELFLILLAAVVAVIFSFIVKYLIVLARQLLKRRDYLVMQQLKSQQIREQTNREIRKDIRRARETLHHQKESYVQHSDTAHCDSGFGTHQDTPHTDSSYSPRADDNDII